MIGKTTTIVACAKKMYGEHYSAMTLELNASDDRGIDVVRDQIKEFAGTKKLFRHAYIPHALFPIFIIIICQHSSGVKLIILDKADSMTADAQSALRRGVVSLYEDSFNSSIPLSHYQHYSFLSD